MRIVLVEIRCCGIRPYNNIALAVGRRVPYKIYFRAYDIVVKADHIVYRHGNMKSRFLVRGCGMSRPNHAVAEIFAAVLRQLCLGNGIFYGVRIVQLRVYRNGKLRVVYPGLVRRNGKHIYAVGLRNKRCLNVCAVCARRIRHERRRNGLNGLVALYNVN